jgi:hypothetical protein
MFIAVQNMVESSYIGPSKKILFLKRRDTISVIPVYISTWVDVVILIICTGDMTGGTKFCTKLLKK